MREFETTRLRYVAFSVRISRLGTARCRDAIEQRRQLLARELYIPESIPWDLPVVRHVDEVALLRNLANLEANHLMPLYPYYGSPGFHVDCVCTNPVREPWWVGQYWEKRFRDKWRYRRSGRHAPVLVATTPLSLTSFPVVPGMGPSYAAPTGGRTWISPLCPCELSSRTSYPDALRHPRRCASPLGGRASGLSDRDLVRSRVL